MHRDVHFSELSLVFITDDPVWCLPLLEACRAAGSSAEAFFPGEALPNALRVNRVAAAPKQNPQDITCQTLRLLEAEDARGGPVVNGLYCHRVAISKWRQAEVFAAARAPAPETRRVAEDSLPAGNWLAKPNQGGKGQGMASLADGSGAIEQARAASPDGMVVLQRAIPHDGFVYRVEMLGGAVLYHARSAALPDDFNYCLAELGETKLSPEAPASLITECCRRIASEAQLELGSIEYLRDRDGTVWFIDINPVSTLAKEAKTELGFDPLERQAKYLTERARELSV